ncbi:MAG: sodium/proton-translocating pyrophosphatase, partial [Nitrospirota bacterium]
MELFINLSPIFGLAGLALAFIIYFSVAKKPVGTDVMREISDMIHDGAMVYLKRQYTILFAFIVLIFILLSVFINIQTGIAYVGGAVSSMLAGFFGMQAATKANVRTAQAANLYKPDTAKALSVAFLGGSVMGLSVASLGLIGIGVFFILYGKPETAAIINGYAMGASSIALFARVGGGIFTKSADVGADLAGKIEAGIPEDDPRNPGVIADNVGDNVGDVAGLGADIFESYVGAVVATIAIGATALAGSNVALLGSTAALMSLPVILIMVGLAASVIGILSMRILESFNPAAALRYATFIAAGIFLILGYAV